MMEIIEQLLGLFVQLLVSFTFYYPLVMAYVWSAGAAWYYLRYELGQTRSPQLRSCPMVSIVVPCFNEEPNVRETFGHLLRMDYPNYEIIAVNDGSRDRTGALLDEMALQHPRLRVVHHAVNQGKSIALNTAAYLARSEFIVGIDGDALLDHRAIPWFLQHFERNPRVGAVTGNPRIRTRSTLLGRLQVGEFSSMVGLIKRAQRVFYRRIFTACGVITAFRRSALHDVGYWSPVMLTEDMDMTWKLQIYGWEVLFEPNALTWILMPETLVGLWKQRLRWAMGGLQIISRYKSMFRHWCFHGMWALLLEHILSMLWAYTTAVMLTVHVISGLGTVVPVVYSAVLSALADAISGPADSTESIVVVSSALSPASLANSGVEAATPEPDYRRVIIATTCLLQMLVSMLLDCRYDRNLMRYFVSSIWYPLGFWMLNMLTIIVALPKLALRKSGTRARWVSPDRGVEL